MGEPINRDYFIPSNARIISDGTPVIRERVTGLTKIGADKLGVGMRLSQNVGIEFKNIEAHVAYRAITSEDGIHWSDVEYPGKEYEGLSGSIVVPTNHFSYFALLSNTITIAPPSCTMNISPTTTTNGSNITLTWNITNAETGSLTPGNTLLASSGSMSLIPPQNTTTQYVIFVNNSAGSSSCSAGVTTAPGPITPNNPSNTNSTTGPGGGGYSIPVKTLDVCVDGDFSGNAYDGSCELPTETIATGTTKTPNTTPVAEVQYLKNKALDELISELEKKENHTLDTRDEQYILYIALNLWKNSIQKPSVLSIQETLVLLRKKTQTVEKMHTKKAVTRIMESLQNFANVSMSPLQEKKTTVSQSNQFRYVDVEHALNMRTSTLLLQNNVITYLRRNEKVQVVEDLGSWTKILYNGIE